jgi:peroxiredoxin/Tfp pilus assembly protein PilF
MSVGNSFAQRPFPGRKFLGVKMNRVTLLALIGLSLTAGNTAQVGFADNPAFTEQFEAGKHALNEGRYKDAAGALKKALKLQPDCYGCYTGLADADRRMGDTKAALEACDKAIGVATRDTTRAYAHNLKGQILMIEAHNPNQLGMAEGEFRTAIQLDRAAPTYHLNLATVLIRQSKDDLAKPELEACMAANPAPDVSKMAQALLADPRRGRESFAPDFKVKTLTGEQVSLQQFAGKVLVMDFWATWCPPCRASVGELKDLTKKYPADKLVLISVSADKDDGAWRDFIEKKHMSWLQYRDSDHQLVDAFGINGFPTYLVIDGEGIVRTRISGLNPQESVVHRLRATLEQMPQLSK